MVRARTERERGSERGEREREIKAASVTWREREATSAKEKRRNCSLSERKREMDHFVGEERGGIPNNLIERSELILIKLSESQQSMIQPN